MCPCLAKFDHADKRLRNTVGTGDIHLRAPIRSNFYDLISRKFGCRSIFSALVVWLQGGAGAQDSAVTLSARLASFGHFVGHVVGIGAEKKMIRVDARPDITAMKNLQAGRNRPILHFPRPDVSISLDCLEAKSPVTVTKGSLPQATPRRVGLGIKLQTLGKRHVVRDAFSCIILGRHGYSPIVVDAQSRVGVISAARLAMVA